jgi:hypothetical protein
MFNSVDKTKPTVKEYADSLSERMIMISEAILRRYGCQEDVLKSVEVDRLTIVIRMYFCDITYCVPEFMINDEDFPDARIKIMRFSESYARWAAYDYLEKIGKYVELEERN